MKRENIPFVLNMLLKELEIPVSRRTIIEELEKHPEYGSMLSISDVLNGWSVPNEPYQLKHEELNNVPVPFIAYCSDKDFVLVNNIDQQRVIVSSQRWNRHSISIDEFKKLYAGYILAIGKDELSGEPDYAIKKRGELSDNIRIPFIVLGTAFIFLLFLLTNLSSTISFNSHIAWLTFFKTGGLITSILLLIQSIDANNPLIQKICGGDDNKNCNAILSSAAAKISNVLSWSEVGFFYFAGTWLILLFNAGNRHLIQVLAVLNLISLPYTLYSIYYQWRVAKQWCIFCCTVQVLLWLEFFAFLPYLQFPLIQSIALRDCSYFIIGMLVPVLLWVFIKPHFINSMQLPRFKQQLYRFKYNKELFQNIIQKEIQYGLPPEEDSIIIGNREANHVITIVSNPFCHACSNAHKLLDELIGIRDDVKLQFVFLSRMRAKDLDKKVLEHFMTLKSTGDDSVVKNALNEWYRQEHKSYDLWQVNYPLNEITDNADALIKQKAWCKMVEITGTPTLFINGRRLPKPYGPEDLKYII